jgi:biopolymer transport protein ExbD
MKKRTREALAPDLTPLIDVVFLLLIFFMVSTVFKKDELALLLNLPKTESGSALQNEKNLTIELSSEQMAINGKVLTLEEISEVMSKVTNKNTPIELRIDKDVRYEKIITLFDKLKSLELSNLSLVTKQ